MCIEEPCEWIDAPRFSVVSWIEDCDYDYTFGLPPITGGIRVDSLLQTTANAPPPLDLSDEEECWKYRMLKDWRAITTLDVSICCRDGIIVKEEHLGGAEIGGTQNSPSQFNPFLPGDIAIRFWADYFRRARGLDPVPRPGPLWSEGILGKPETKVTYLPNEAAPTCIVVKRKTRLMVGLTDQILRMPAAGAYFFPFAWVELTVALCCDGSYMWLLGSSCLPSQSVYRDGKMIAEYRMCSGDKEADYKCLARFVRAGSFADAPTANPHGDYVRTEPPRPR